MIRELEEQDAAAFLELCRLLDVQTSFRLLEPDERQTTVEEQIQRIRDVRGGQRENVWIAEVEGKLVGFLGATVGGVKRNRHSANLAMGVLSDYWGRAIGQGLLEALEVWARSRALRRLALTVMTHNVRALRLYLKRGFIVEGLRRDALRIDGCFVDEYWMAKLLT
jgi:RimJ/RimL family protein N-acetyltransferase